MPATAATVMVPLKAPPPALVPIAIVTLEVFEVTTLPNWSSIDTCTAGLMETPATALAGCTVKASCVAAAAVILKAPVVVPVRAPSLAASV